MFSKLLNQLFLFILLFCLIFSASKFSNAQVLEFPQQRKQAMNLPVYLPSGSHDPNVPLPLMPGFPLMPDTAMLMDNFEYWDSPFNHGWHTSDPPYPTWGVGIGYGNFNTVMDNAEGSRVLDVYRASTVFMPDMEKYVISYRLPGAGLRGSFNVLCMKINSAVTIEEFDRYEIIIVCNDGTLEFHLHPTGDPLMPVYRPEETAKASYETITSPTGTYTKTIVNAQIGKESSDGTWHLIIADLQKMTEISSAPSINVINTFMIAGNYYKMDDIKFMTPMAAKNLRHGRKPPNLFRINHIYTQLYDHFRRYVFGSDDFADKILITQEYIGVTGTGLTGQIADENSQIWIDDVNYYILAEYGINNVSDVPGLSRDSYRDIVVPGLTLANGSAMPQGGLAQLRVENPNALVNVPILNMTLPASLLYPLDVHLLRDQMMRLARPMHEMYELKFFWFVGANPVLDLSCTTEFPMNNLSTTDSLQPQYHPLWRTSSPLTQNPYLAAFEIEMIRVALLQAGYKSWPTIAALNFTEQIVENMMNFVFLTNGAQADVETFIVTTTNYPVTNYPPVFQDVHDQVMYIGKGPQSYQVSATDADSFSISLAENVGFKSDISQITYRAFMNNLPAYLYGPWSEDIINQKTGLITIDPKFEGTYEITIIARDPKGAEATNSFMLHCVNSQSWFNHAPVITFDIETDPIFIIAGNEFVLKGLEIVDPDGGPVYYSSNIGAVNADDKGNPIWTFHTVFDGPYMLQIVAYDMQGGYTTFNHMVMVMPWFTPHNVFNRGIKF